MRFARHETFYFREGWLTKGLRKIETEQMKDVFQRDDAMEQLGIGKNMVLSLRYWMQATGLTEETGAARKQQNLTNIGKIIYEYDPYLEEEFTLWLLHYHLITNREMATTWYWFFNVFKQREFDEETFIKELDTYIKEENPEDKEFAYGSLKKDFDCLVSMYTPDNRLNINPEDNLNCPLQDLRLLEVVDLKKKRYRLNRKSIQEIPKELFLYGILEFQKNNNQGKDISIESLLYEELSIGRVFVLGLSELIQVLEILQEDNALYLSKTAGLNHVSIKTDVNPQSIIKSYYLQNGSRAIL